MKKIFFISFLILSVLTAQTVGAQNKSVTDKAKNAASKSVNDVKNTAKKTAENTKKEAEKKAVQAKALMQDFVLFLVSFASFESPFEDFKDLFRNTCQVSDISTVQNLMDKTRQELRSAGLRGNNEEYEAKKKQLLQLAFELYFLRNLVDTTDGKFVVQSQEKLTKDLEATFTTQLKMSRQEIYAFVEGLMSKYTPALKEYRECNQTSEWKKVEKRFKKLVKDFKEAGESLGNTAVQGAKDIKKSYSISKKDGVKRSVGGAVLNYLSEHTSVNLPKAAPRIISPDEIDRIKRFVPGVSGNVYEQKNISELSTELEKTRYIFAVETEVAQLKAKYEIIYGDAGDSAAKDILNKVDQLNETIKTTTTKVMPKVLECVAIPNNKQCTKIK